MIFKKIVVGPLTTNCYIFGSSKTREVVVIDPGFDIKEITQTLEELNARPIAVLLTHAHFDHVMKLKKFLRSYDIPVMYDKKEINSGFGPFSKKDKWLREGDTILVGELTLHVLETPGHSPGSLCYYCKDVKEYKGQQIDGIIFTGDLIFRRSIGRSDVPGGDQSVLFESIKKKIMYNPNLSDNFIIFPGHMGRTSIGEEKEKNMFRQFFL
ncbi:MAG: MBL fold metallo-hydrolase [Promethearchaeota archaeon]